MPLRPGLSPILHVERLVRAQTVASPRPAPPDGGGHQKGLQIAERAIGTSEPSPLIHVRVPAFTVVCGAVLLPGAGQAADAPRRGRFRDPAAAGARPLPEAGTLRPARRRPVLRPTARRPGLPVRPAEGWCRPRGPAGCPGLPIGRQDGQAARAVRSGGLPGCPGRDGSSGGGAQGVPRNPGNARFNRQGRELSLCLQKRFSVCRCLLGAGGETLRPAGTAGRYRRSDRPAGVPARSGGGVLVRDHSSAQASRTCPGQ